MGHVASRSSTLMTEYTTKPLPVMAVQLTDANAREVALMVGGKLYPADNQHPLRLYFHCCSGRAKAEWGDWVLRDAKGFHTMTNSEFTTTYQEKP